MNSRPPNTTQLSNTKPKNKKLHHEYSGFEQKVGYFLLTASYNGPKYNKNDISPVYLKCPEVELEVAKSKIDNVKEKNLSAVATTINKWNNHFQPFYTLYRQIHLTVENDKTKKNILIRLKEMFDDNTFDACMLVYTGPCSPNGGLLIESKEFGTEELFFQDVLQQWFKRTSKQKHLLIILDCNYAGKWALDFHNYHEKIETISVLASCRENQKAFYFELGMYFTYNIMKYFSKNQSENLVHVNQTPVFIGDYLDCKKYTNLYLNFSSFANLSAIQKSDFAMIEYENGTYVGHIENGRKHFWGVFVWRNGLFKDCKYIGEFKNGKLEGKGIMTYTNGRVYEGEFKNNAPDGLAVESYENGDKYIGKFVSGSKNGYGLYVYANGEIYEGQFENNKPCGQGRLIVSKNSYYEGTFKNGKCNGQGKYGYPNGDIYEGQWLDSVKHGKGRYIYANGDIYEGDFVHGFRQGKGKLGTASGDLLEGIWENDQFMSPIKLSSENDQNINDSNKGKIDKQTSHSSKLATQKIQSRFN